MGSSQRLHAYELEQLIIFIKLLVPLSRANSEVGLQGLYAFFLEGDDSGTHPLAFACRQGTSRKVNVCGQEVTQLTHANAGDSQARG